MADKTVIVEIQYDTEAAIKSLNELTASVEGEKVAQAKLKAELEAGTLSQKEYSIEVEKSKQKAAAANTERKTTLQLITAEKGSINELKANIKLLTSERDKLNRNTVEGRKAASEYTAKINEMKASLKDAQSETKKTGGAFATLGENIKTIPGPIGGVINGFVGMTKAAIAFIATPIGAILAGIGLALKALISYFKGSEEGQNRLNKIMSIFNTIMGNLGDLVQKVGKWIYEAVSKPKETIIALGELIKENLINRFKAFGEIGKAIAKIFSGEFKQGFKDLADGAIQMTTGVANGIDKIKQAAIDARNAVKSLVEENKKELDIAKNLADRQAALDLLQRQFLVERAKLEKESAELRQQAADKANLTDRERLALLQQAVEKENKILDTNLKIAQEKAAIKKIQNDLSNSTKEDLNEQAQLEADIFNVQKENAMKKKELTAQIAELQNKISKENIDREEFEQMQLLEIRGEAIVKLSELKQQEFDEMARITLENNDVSLENEQEYQERLRAIREQALQQSYSDLQGIIAATQNMADMRVTILSDAFAKISTINFKEKEAAKATYTAIGQAAMQLTNSIVGNYENEFAELSAQKAAELALVGDNVAAKADLDRLYAQKENALKKKQFEENKKKAIIDGAIATALAVLNGLTTQPFFPLGIAMAAFAAVLGGIQIASIAKQNYTPSATFAKGGIIGGKSHADGGTQFWGSDGSRFEAEKGEAMFVMKKDATAEIAALSAINESHGGRSFFERSPAGHFADGGEVTKQASDIRKTINDEIDRRPIYVRVGDIQTGMTDVENSKSVGVV